MTEIKENHNDIDVSKETTDDQTATAIATTPATLPYSLSNKLFPVLSQHGIAYVGIFGKGNAYVLRIGEKQLNNFIRRTVGKKVSNKELHEINECLMASAEMSGKVLNVYSRVAPIDGGIELDLCDTKNTRIRVTADEVNIIEHGSSTLFFRNSVSQPMIMPALEGDLNLLKKYVNLSATDFLLFIAWLSYTLAHPKISSSKYVFLALQGDQGSGKSFICQNIIINLLDPSRVGVQVFPKNSKDLAIAMQSSHVLCYDNLRSFKDDMSDTLCIASTGGNISCRALYTDGTQHAHYLHGALVLNGIHSFITQPDLEQRFLTIHTKTLPKSDRKSEFAMISELEAEIPEIYRGLLDLMADVFKHLPDAEITSPERMLDFVHWLAAMEKVDGAPLGTYQALYSSVLHQSQLDTLLENLIASTIIDFVQDHMDDVVWSGTPADLLEALCDMVHAAIMYSAEWPKNPIALSRRLKPLTASLRGQGIGVEFTRGKNRTITLTKLGENND